MPNIQSDRQSSQFLIGPVLLERDGAPQLIAEIGVNHFGDLSEAFYLIDVCIDAGIKLIKFQHFNVDYLISKGNAEWRERLLQKQLSNSQILECASYTASRGGVFLCTAHDESVLDFLDKEVNVSAFKIGSGEVENLPYIYSILKRGKPVVVSTGMYTNKDIDNLIDCINESGNREVALLHCISSYPAHPKLANLSYIAYLKSIYSGPIGYSDHTVGSLVPLLAVQHGASIIEKHITRRVNVPNAQDWKVSLLDSELSHFVDQLNDSYAAIGLGSIHKNFRNNSESVVYQWARKSICFSRDMSAGEVIEVSDFRFMRPADGLSPSLYQDFVGKNLKRDVLENEVLRQEDLE